MNKLRVRCSKSPLFVMSRHSQWMKKRIAYIIAISKPRKYKYGRSRIIYIGTSKVGVNRLAASASHRGRDAFKELRGVKTISVHIVTCTSRRSLKTWAKLEASLLDSFFRTYGALPHYNKRKPAQRDGIFSQSRPLRILGQFATPPVGK